MPDIYDYHYQNKPAYEQRSRSDAEAGYILASAASAIVMGALPYFSKPFIKQIKNEHANNHLYRDAFIKSVRDSGLVEKGLTLEHYGLSNSDLAKVGTRLESSIVNKDLKLGLNACYVPDTKTIRLNIDKASIAGFHELGHAKNHLEKGFGHFMQKCRKPGMILAGIMGSIALLSRNKPKDAKRDFGDFIQDNCGKLAVLGILPTVIEESMASYKGVKMAKRAGLQKDLVKNLRKFYGKALLSYGGYALITGLSVFAASKIMEKFTRPKKINTQVYY